VRKITRGQGGVEQGRTPSQWARMAHQQAGPTWPSQNMNVIPFWLAIQW